MLPLIFLLLLIYITGLSNAGNTRQRTTQIPIPQPGNLEIATKLITLPIDIVSFDQLIFEMDNTEQCNKTLSGPLIHGLVNDSFKNGQYDKNVEYILESINNVENIDRKLVQIVS
jgi:hypothetical protein